MSQSLFNRRILLGVTGGIAAYKTADLVRRLREAGAEVRVVMTPAATAFITPLTLQAVSGHPVRTELMDPSAEAAMGHIELARWADTVLIAPASADFLARVAHGFADDLLSTVCLATAAPIVLAPAMNHLMWQNSATQSNVAVLQGRGVVLLGPASGEQACGEVGPGRMLEPAEIVAALDKAKRNGPLEKRRVLITAGPTREPIDPVRYVTNRSSGKMGFAIAAAAAAGGAEVSLVSGPVHIPVPAGVDCIFVETAAQMHGAVLERLENCDIFIATAAVADYRPSEPVGKKIKKDQPALQLEMSRTHDILADVASEKFPPFTVGFAAETDNVEAYAEEKRRRKGVDMIAANQVDGGGLGFESDENALHVFWEGGSSALPRQSKQTLAVALIELIAQRYVLKQQSSQ
ncbi:MAG: bifunctional phosphopantothenoylcysteine decarboxylase/phosphopantothenate--cysteine ligase CoaBC [Pseudomonadota bacterium]|nr:bifunctional phosphopantothenoylcysteine decarboxylase/phosphopantothenate--cysteine ligase CoaBC [Pseudomonadota bacterium]